MICVMLLLIRYDLMRVEVYIWPLPKSSLALGSMLSKYLCT